MAIQLRFEDNIKEVAGRLEQRTPAILEALRTRMNSLLVRLQSQVQLRHLSAPSGFSATQLHQRSGKLISSIRVTPAEQTDTGLEGSVHGAGGPAWYGRVHEFGGSWTVPAREAVRQRFSKTGKLIGAKTFGVKGGTVTMPERSFMRASLAELKDAIITEMREAVKTGLGT
jgi:phage gpG-like protein